MDVSEIGFLYCGYYLLDKGFFYPRYFTEKTHCFGVRDAYVLIYVILGAVRNYEWTRVIQVDECCIRNERILIAIKH